MTYTAQVAVGSWYQDVHDQMFEVVAYDEADGYIEIQFFEGEVAELEPEVWAELRPLEIQAPEDWTGAYDELERDDLGYSDDPVRHQDWNSPLNSIEPDLELV